LLQVAAEPTVWLVQNGFKRPFKSRSALVSRYDIKKIITVTKNDLDKYITGAPISFSQYSIVRAPSGALYLLVDDTRRGFISAEAFRKLGFNSEEIVNGSWEDLKAYTEVTPITATSSYPVGALLQDKTTGGVYWVMNGQKSPILDRVYLSTMFRGKKPYPVTPAELEKYEKIEPVRFADGELLKGYGNPAVYVLADGKKRPIVSAKVFESLKYSWNNIILVPDRLLELYSEGEPLAEKSGESIQTDLASQTATSSLPLLATSTVSAASSSLTASVY
jgi:hypothetical protein